jgi:hypothetical protein
MSDSARSDLGLSARTNRADHPDFPDARDLVLAPLHA